VDHPTEHVSWPEVTQWMAVCAPARLPILASTASILVVGVVAASAQSPEHVPQPGRPAKF
jgi:hypothetical protein